MKKKILALAVLLALAVCLIPYQTSSVLSGTGEIRRETDGQAEECALSITVSETRSLLFRYRKQFSYILNGQGYDAFLTATCAETGDGACLISQMYYDEQTDQIRPCSLYLAEDLSYAEVILDSCKIVVRNPGVFD